MLVAVALWAAPTTPAARRTPVRAPAAKPASKPAVAKKTLTKTPAGRGPAGGASGSAIAGAGSGSRTGARTATGTPAGLPIPLTAPVSAPVEVRKWMDSLTLRHQIAQLIIVACYGEAPGAHTREFQNFAYQVQAIGVGGLIVNNRVVNGLARNAEPQTMVSFLNRMQELAKVPLIVGGDFERGASMRVANTTKFPHAMAYGAARDYAATKLMGQATARASNRYLSFQLVRIHAVGTELCGR